MTDRLRRDLMWRVPLYQRWMWYLRVCKNWPEIIRFERCGGDLQCVETRAGPTIALGDPHDGLQMLGEIWRGRDYTREYSATPKMVVDVGANIGMFSILAHTLWPAARVIAYEPDEANFSLLQSSIEQSRLDRIELVREAVAAAPGSQDLYTRERGGWSSLYLHPGEARASSGQVPTVGLEEVLERAGGTIDFLKLDCEGAEWAILAGKERLLRASVSYIAMEFHSESGRSVDEILDLLAGSGFQSHASPVDEYGTCMIFSAR